MGKASRTKRTGKAAEPEAAVLWAVMMDGQLGNMLFSDAAGAEVVARSLRDQHPTSVVEWCQVGVLVMLRRPLRPKIATP